MESVGLWVVWGPAQNPLPPSGRSSLCAHLGVVSGTSGDRPAAVGECFRSVIGVVAMVKSLL
jgi:hypothetical protein